MADIDAAMSQGPGMRFAHMGPFQTYHLAAGDGGIAQYLEHLGPSQVPPRRVQLSRNVRPCAHFCTACAAGGQVGEPWREPCAGVRPAPPRARGRFLTRRPGWRRSGLKEKIVAGVDDMVEGKSIAGASVLFRFGARQLGAA